MNIFDTFLFFNELDLLEIRLNTLGQFVDYFVITEATVTFAGKPKSLYFLNNSQRFAKFRHQIIHNVVTDTPLTFGSRTPQIPYFTERAKSHPHKSGGTPLECLSMDFQREVFQRDSIIHGLLGRAAPDDLILISDLDEIPDPKHLRDAATRYRADTLYNFSQRWYMYYLNVLYEKEWFGTRACHFSYLAGRSIDLIRHHLENRDEQEGPIIEDGGWHFSFLGGPERIKDKLAAYSYQGRRTAKFLRLLDIMFPGRIARRIAANKDIFNTRRKFKTVGIDSSFPLYLVENLPRYSSYLKA